MPSDDEIRDGLHRMADSIPHHTTEADLFLAADRGQRRRRTRRVRTGAMAAIALIATIGLAAVAWPDEPDAPIIATLEASDATNTTSTTTESPSTTLESVVTTMTLSTTTFPPISTTTWDAPLDDPTQPSPAALEADEGVRSVPPGIFDCGTAFTTSGYPTTTIPRLEQLDCIVDAAATGDPAQFAFAARNFTGGMTGTIYRINTDGTFVEIDYEVDLAGIVVRESTAACSEFRASGPFPELICVPFPANAIDDTEGAPTEAALAADAAQRAVPAGRLDCGSVIITAGWPTTVPADTTGARCIVDAAQQGVPAQYAVTGRDFEGGMAGRVFEVDEPGPISVTIYSVSPEGNVGTSGNGCGSLRFVENSPTPVCEG